MDHETRTKRDSDRRSLRKRTELSLGIPLIAICLLVSPLVNGFTSSGGQTSFTSIIVYIFGVWAALILAALLMSRILNDDVKDD